MHIKSNMRFILVVIILGLCNLFVYKSIFTTPTVKTPAFTKTFPSQISNWTAKEVIYDKKILEVLSPDKIIYKTYHRDGSQPITLFISCYYTLEKAGLSHSPIVCFTGQGWEISETSKKILSVNFPDTPTIKVNQLIQKRLGTTLITLFWYQSVDHTFSNRGIQKIFLFFEKLLGKPDRNAFVRVTMDVSKGRSVEETTAELYEFICDLYPELRRFFL